MNKGGYQWSLTVIIILFSVIAMAIILFFLFKNIDNLFASL